MQLDLDTRRELVKRLPDLSSERLSSISRKHVELRQRFLARLLSLSYERRSPHATDRTADSFSRNFLTDGLKAAPQGDTYKRLLEPLFEFPSGNRGYSRGAGTTKAYRLRQAVAERVEHVYSADDPVPVVDGSGATVGNPLPPNLPASVACSLRLPKFLPVSESTIDRAIEHVARWTSLHGPTLSLDPARLDGLSLGEARRHLLVARRWHRSLGGLPNFYSEQSHGRLGPVGWHVIRLPSTVRRLLFEGSGLLDYDLASCFWSIFASLGKQLGFQTSHAEDYLAAKQEWHRRWSVETGHVRSDDFKKVAVSWLTGGLLSAVQATSTARLIGRQAVERLANDPWAQQLHSEAREGMKAVVRYFETGPRTVRNAVDRTLTHDGGPQGFSRACAHVLTGLEQFAIRKACSRTHDLVAIIYDGFIAPAQDVEALEAHIRATSTELLGLTLGLRLKQSPLAFPPHERLLPEWDF